jgi:hypothetical protein
MRYLLLLGLAGCATPYAGLTNAQIKWAQAYRECEGVTHAGCDAVRERFAQEDAAERLARAEPSRYRFNPAPLAAMHNPNAYVPTVNVYQTTPVSCTSVDYGHQVKTTCR